jgi:nicotinate-nucleotide adenylyltransferase
MSDAARASPLPELAILGGSFDPPHLGHVFLAAYALAVGGVERVLVVPVFEHAFAKPLSPFAHRLTMCELAFRDLRRVEVSALERELGGVSRTLRLIDALAQRYPHHRLRTLIGTDILAESHRWQGFAEIERRAPLLVAGRSGHEPADAAISGPLLPAISSSEIRARLGAGEDPGGLLPREVLRYAREQRLYGAEPAR